MNSNIKTISIVIIIVLVLAGILFYKFKSITQPADQSSNQTINQNTQNTQTPSQNYKDINILIDGQKIKLENGYAETKIDNSLEEKPGVLAKIITKYFGNELKTDLNGDGKTDIAYIVTQDGGGSGLFYYAVAAIATDKGYVGSDGYLLGDRIAPQSTNISSNPKHKNVIVFNYSDRSPTDPMSTPPSIGKSAYLKIDPETLHWGIVMPDFEGESR